MTLLQPLYQQDIMSLTIVHNNNPRHLLYTVENRVGFSRSQSLLVKMVIGISPVDNPFAYDRVPDIDNVYETPAIEQPQPPPEVEPVPETQPEVIITDLEPTVELVTEPVYNYLIVALLLALQPTGFFPALILHLKINLVALTTLLLINIWVDIKVVMYLLYILFTFIQYKLYMTSTNYIAFY